MQGVFFLLHPGPSLLVTIVFVAVVALAAHAFPAPARLLQLIGVMLPVQFTIGIVNDLADARADAASKPYKPLVRGAVRRDAGVVIAIALGVLGVALAFTVGLVTGIIVCAGLGAGLLYDLGLRRTVLSWLPWWIGFTALPLAAFAAANRLTLALLLVVPLALLASLSLHCANALPDIDADRSTNQVSLPVRLGSRASRGLALGSLAAAAVVVGISSVGVSDGTRWLLVGEALVTLLVVMSVRARRTARPFPPMAAATALLAMTWLAAALG